LGSRRIAKPNQSKEPDNSFFLVALGGFCGLFKAPTDSRCVDDGIQIDKLLFPRERCSNKIMAAEWQDYGMTELWIWRQSVSAVIKYKQVKVKELTANYFAGHRRYWDGRGGIGAQPSSLLRARQLFFSWPRDPPLLNQPPLEEGI